LTDEQRAPDPWQSTFESHAEFDLVLLDGERWHCHLVKWARDGLLVTTDRGTYLVPRHSIKCVVLDEPVEELLEEIAAEVPALQEFLESEPAQTQPREIAGNGDVTTSPS
jgi:hypothetical protein